MWSGGTAASLAFVLVSAVVSFMLAAILVGRFRGWAVRRQILDFPNQRSLHTGAVPRGGGIAIVALTLAGLLVVHALRPIEPVRLLLAYIGAGAFVATLSWIDDVRGLPAFVRLAGHLAAAAIVVSVCGGLHVLALPGAGTFDIGVAGTLLAIAWIVGLTNAFNFMDGSDGIAALQAVVAGAGLVVIGLLAQQPLMVWVSVLIAGASAGFLRRNWAPADVFMGDVGSAFLGYSLATVSLMGASSDPRLAAAGVLVVWPFVFDTGFTLLQRLRRGERVWEAHRSHLYQRSITHGAGHSEVAIAYAVAAAVGVFAAVLWTTRVDDRGLIAVGAIIAVAVYLWVRTTVRERRKVPVAPHA